MVLGGIARHLHTRSIDPLPAGDLFSAIGFCSAVGQQFRSVGDPCRIAVDEERHRTGGNAFGKIRIVLQDLAGIAHRHDAGDQREVTISGGLAGAREIGEVVRRPAFHLAEFEIGEDHPVVARGRRAVEQTKQPIDSGIDLEVGRAVDPAV